MDQFYNRTNGPHNLVNDLIKVYNTMMTVFESHKSKFATLNSNKKDLKLEMERLLQEKQDILRKEGEKITVKLPENEIDLYELISNEKELKPGLEVFRQTKWLKNISQTKLKFLFMTFI